MTGTPALRPPERWKHLRWHWIYAPCSGPEPWQWDTFNCMWLPTRETTWHSPSLFPSSRYVGPCDPAAIVTDPEDEAQRRLIGIQLGFYGVELVMRSEIITAILMKLRDMTKGGGNE